MGDIEEILAQMVRNPEDVRFSDLSKVCNHYFGKPRQSGVATRFIKLLGRTTRG